MLIFEKAQVTKHYVQFAFLFVQTLCENSFLIRGYDIYIIFMMMLLRGKINFMGVLYHLLKI